jgi:anti-sigma-K factor RskA
LLEAAIGAWERRLAPLDAETGSVAPPGDLFARIERRIDLAPSTAPAAEPAIANVTELAELRRQLRSWRRMAVAASMMAASLLLLIGIRETADWARRGTYVAVFQKDDVAPAFYLTINLKTRELTLRPVRAERQPGKTYQLWIASDQIGPAPQSLGLVNDDLAPTRKSLTGFDPALLRRATFGVSLEPEGGSPTGRPTSPALHAKLLPATN